MRQLIAAGLDLLFPPSCPSCKQVMERSPQQLCATCYAKLQRIKNPYCSRCGKRLQGGEENHLCGDCLQSHWLFEKARSFFLYEKTIAHLIHDLKYSGDLSVLSALSWLSLQSELLYDLDEADYILPVPLHTSRLRKRGFNQSLLLAKGIFAKKKERIKFDLLSRIVDTIPQTGLTGKQRRKNLKNAFMVTKPDKIAGKNILLVDDVFTTGSTVQECTKALKQAGCNRVEVVTLCRTDQGQ